MMAESIPRPDSKWNLHGGDSTLLSGESDSIYKYNKGDAEANETNKKPNKKIKTYT